MLENVMRNDIFYYAERPLFFAVTRERFLPKGRGVKSLRAKYIKETFIA